MEPEKDREIVPMKSLEPPIDEMSSYSSSINQDDTVDRKRSLRKKSPKRQSPKKSGKSKRKSNKLTNPTISEAERMKEYVEDRLTPFKTEISRAFDELSKIFDEDFTLQKGMVVKSIRAMQTMHESIVKKYSVLKVNNNKSEAKLESQIKLNKHLEENLVNTIKEKDDADIQLKSEIRVLERKLEDAMSKINATQPDETVIEKECRELKEIIQYSQKLLDENVSK